MMKKSLILAACAALITVGANAQETETFHKYNWFVTGGVNTEAFMNTDGYVTATGKIGAGLWINPWAGLKLEGVAGNTHLLTDSRGQVFGAHLTYMTHLYGGKKYRPFNLNAVLGMGFYHHKFGDILQKYSYMNILTGNLGIQAVYNITPKWSVYVEPGISLQPKYYNVNDKDKLTVSAYLSAGITYSFNNLFDNISKGKSKEVAAKPVNSAEIDRMNQQINDMRAQIEGLQDELEKSKVVDARKKVVLEPMREMPAVNIQFDTMGDYLNEQEAAKLDDIGVWMQDHPNSISVVPFADSQADVTLEKELKQKRVDAITKVLTEKYGIDRKRILTASAEELGYVNKTQAAAMIIFMSE